ncbi:GNAT family N-acetyltransferase [Methylosinus sp. Sm6]|uniref:GNAT family N-acetyltransferase n=1 Tax=Methylosinus sp. Sm6 TaxID=2866948 RepID=UPI001C99623F|nr:GNAT family N-acetyltransferase [Methylosinus sp. Sm6]
MSGSRIRAAGAADAESIAALNLACWRETYSGLLPAETMAELTSAERLHHWRAAFAADTANVLLTIDDDGVAVGFSEWRPHQFAFRGRIGRGAEISAIYLLRSAQRRGLGRALMRRMAQEMRADGLKWAGLVVLRDNLPARRFYEALGGRRFGRETVRRGAPQLAYGWRDLARLAGDGDLG